MTTPYPDFTYKDRRYYGLGTDNAYQWFIGAMEPRSGTTTPLYQVQIGAYGHLNFIIFNEWEDMESVIEEVGAWLADHAPGNLTSQDEMDELYAEAAQDLYPDKMAQVKEGEWWHDFLGPSERDEVREAAEADLTYTEAGWLPSYEMHISEVQVGTPLFGEAFNYAMFDYEDGISDNIEYMVDEIEDEQISPSGVMKILKKLGVSDEDREHIWTELTESNMFGEDYQYFDMTD